MLHNGFPIAVLALVWTYASLEISGSADEKRSHISVRGIYGGVPTQILDRGQTLEDYGINAVWIGAGALTHEKIEVLRSQKARVFAEFNTLHDASYLKEHPDAVPVGSNGEPCPPPDGWQGICPTHQGYRTYRMKAFRTVLQKFAIDGIWLDYHHSHASWEQPVPNLPDTCFCTRCTSQFARDTKTTLPDKPARELAVLLLGKHRTRWTQWRCDIFTDWVREFRSILAETQPRALLGTFHAPWSDADFGGARISKLAIDLKAQAKYIDVFSPMPYHARFGHVKDPEWISRQTTWLGEYLRISGTPADKKAVWPIVQLSDWGEPVQVEQIRAVLDYGTRRPATGVIVFAWGRLHQSWNKVEEMALFLRGIRE